MCKLSKFESIPTDFFDGSPFKGVEPAFVSRLHPALVQPTQDVHAGFFKLDVDGLGGG